ncbi:MAG: putative membrane protein [uncultured Nocardioidaceae bacterium]|uniref:Putative membrane protein n=1 Tax=uncultured Nocardioidaceae bacterium TaxID=253824 RepID=A0A6J4MV61_9ACTN|nr:MAG: putative membrane protein [uncultured Nocardioidaceae bacterium]
MEPVLLVLGGGAVVAAALHIRTRIQNARSDRQGTKSELSSIRQLAEEDAVLFGEELTRLDARVADAELDEDTRLDYQAALDSYEAALRVADKMRSIDAVSEVVDALAAGRYSAACVVARLEGKPLPAFKVPCFFDPRHGPASTEVLWTAAGRGTRKVPACAQDAARQADGEKVDVKMVWVNGQEVPYWAAGGLHQPYERGYAPRTVREATLDQRSTYDQFTNSQYWGGGGFPT